MLHKITTHFLSGYIFNTEDCYPTDTLVCSYFQKKVGGNLKVHDSALHFQIKKMKRKRLVTPLTLTVHVSVICPR